MNNNKFLICGLLSIVLIMAVGYAAFATQLNITGTVGVNSSWHVHYVKNTTSYVSTAGLSGAREPIATMEYDDGGYVATIFADMQQPGDKVVYTLTVINDGTIDAELSGPNIVSANNDKFVTYSVTPLGTKFLDAGNTTTFTVTVTYNDVMSSDGSHSITPDFNYDSDNDGVNDVYQVKADIVVAAVQKAS